MVLKSLIAAAAIAVIAPLASAHGIAVTAGDLIVHGGFTRATLPGAPVAGGFVTINNKGTAEDRLTGATAPFAATVEIHEMAMDGGVMTMRPLPDGVPIPAGGKVDLKPGGLHLMFTGLTGPLKQGETVEVIMTFERTGAVTVPMMVLAPGAKSVE